VNFVFVGVDVAQRCFEVAVLAERREVVEPGCTLATEEELLARLLRLAPPEGIWVGVDAPLTWPTAGKWRPCDRLLQQEGIPLYSPLMPHFRLLAERGMALAARLRAAGMRCEEVYPYAARVRLGLGRGAKKHTRAGRQAIQKDLSRHLDLRLGRGELLSHDALDALIAAYTMWLYAHGQAEALGDAEGTIVVPRRIEGRPGNF